MKKGDKVKCVECGGAAYLTDGKIYDVTAGEGDLSVFGCTIKGANTFQIIGDSGDISYCMYPQDAHATWELIK